MPRIGSDAIPQAVQSRVDASQQQLGGALTMPEAGIVSHVGAFLRGVAGYGAVGYRLALWDGSTRALLGQTAARSTSSGTVAPGSLVRQIAPLEVAVQLAAGATFLVGVSTDTAPGKAAQWGVASSGNHDALDQAPGASWPAAMTGSRSDPGALSAWVEEYAPIIVPPVEPPEPVSAIAGPACDALAALMPLPPGVKLDDSLTQPAAILPGRLYCYPRRLGSHRLEDANGRWDEAALRVRLLVTLGARGEVRGPAKDRQLTLALDAALVAMVGAIASHRRTALWWDAYVEAFVYDAVGNDRTRGAGLDVVLRLNLPSSS